MTTFRRTAPRTGFAADSRILFLCRSRRGFTLIETLVSFMVLSVSLVIVMQLFSGGLKSNAVSTDYMYGIYHAREVTEELLLNEALMPGVLGGEFEDGYRWEALVAPPPLRDEEKENTAAVLLDITVTVRWISGSREKHFSIRTSKIAGNADGFTNVAARG